MSDTNQPKHDLYQDLPSITPRVSREERLSMRGICLECRPDSYKKLQKNVRTSYYFFFFLIVLSLGVFRYYKNQQHKQPAYTNQIMVHSLPNNRTISLSLIDQDARYGTSLLFRNNDKSTWNLNSITLEYDGFLTNVTIDSQILPDKFYTEFITLPQKITDLQHIILNVD